MIQKPAIKADLRQPPTASSAPAEHTQDAQEDLDARPAPPRATFFRSFVYAGQGLWYALRTQRNARVHFTLAICAIALGIALRISPVEFAMIFVAITTVFIAEMFNTVAEACVDLATQEYHPLARIAKDVAAGAVLLSAMLAVVIGLLVFGPHLWALIVR
jgi:diacylglycerol kinase